MKKIFNLFLISILSLSALKAQAQTLSVASVKTDLTKQLVESCRRYTDATVKVKIIALPFADLTLPEGQVSYVVSSTVDKFLPRDLKKVNVYVNDKYVKTFNVPVEIHAYKNVLVASGFVERDKMINSTTAVVKNVDISNNLDYALTSDCLGKEIITKKGFRDGEVIDKRFVRLRPDIQRNANVTAYFTSENLMVEVDAIALGDGMLGDYVSVENKKYKKTYTGKVIGENKVLIKI